MPAGVMRQYALLVKRQRALETQLSAVKKEKEALEPLVLEVFLSEGGQGIQHINIEGETLYRAIDVWVSAGEGGDEALNAALRAHGLEALISERADRSRLSAYVREQRREGRAIPPDLLAALSVTERERVRAVAAGKKNGSPAGQERSEEGGDDVP